MRKIRKEELREALRCCRAGTCEGCPLQEEICDELTVPMDDVPAELLDMIDEVLSETEGKGWRG